MFSSASGLSLSATDLSNFLNCRHRTALELGEARGKQRRPQFNDPVLEALLARGLEHERHYVESLQRDRRDVVDLASVQDRADAVARTIEALRAGAEAVVQGALEDGAWFGRPDVLLKRRGASAFGDWEYEVADTKLARETRGGTILQLGLYCEMLNRIQGSHSEHFYVVTPETGTRVHEYRVDDFGAYFRLIRARLEVAVLEDDAALAAANYPEPVDHCDVCPWSVVCSKKRRADDHLSLVAGISRMQRRELEARSIQTLTALAGLAVPLPFKPGRGAVETYVRVREQARVQLEARETSQPVCELLPVAPAQGLSRLPEPSPYDLFLDLEGDPFVGESGREYLFGLVSLGPDGQPAYRAYWAHSEHEERAAFDAVMAIIMEAWERDHGAHVYHYAPYEPSAFKRLSCRYATREQDVDNLLRSDRFVDLYHVVRQALRAGVERYSIKNMEPFYGFTRMVPLLDASRALRAMEQALELGRRDMVTTDLRDTVQGYNADDCVSTLRLRDWLESKRNELLAAGFDVPRPGAEENDASEKVTERALRVAALRARLLAGISEVRADRDEEQQARWLLAYMLDWHRRESSAGWWEYFRLRDLADDNLFDEPQAVAGLVFVERLEQARGKSGKPTGSVIDRYRYPLQEMEVRPNDDLKLKDGTFGKVVAVDRAEMTIDVRKGPKQADNHPSAAFAHTHVSADALEDALFALGDTVAGLESVSSDESSPVGLACSLLLSVAPRLRSGVFAPMPDEGTVEFAVRISRDLDGTVLAIQGPPGAGKTYTGAQMIRDLVRQGKRIGVTANSHKVIRNLLDAIAGTADGPATDLKLAHRKDGGDEDVLPGGVVEIRKNEEALEALTSGDANVLGGTAWLWARPEFAHSVDVLFVDEAGQMSLANVLAICGAAKSMVLLGDPQQLEQPQKGSHPEGVSVSALQHILGAHLTIPADRGVFLPITWRLAPRICAFTSELFYEGRLVAKVGLEHQRLAGGPVPGSGLWVVEVEHEGNRNASDEEVFAVADLVARLIAPGSLWVDQAGASHQMTAHDILVVAPYNAHVSRLTDGLRDTGVQVGTVDRFQGQEAPVVVYSMATSRPEDAPRGLEFLYSLNRLNVATSRAQCAVILVASPHLFVPDCSTPRQMKLANALCRYRELANAAGGSEDGT